ncbi:ABC transporter substrate-binding protein [Parasphaerochaeta coccoides]|uniref:Extracellular solute-binding protein family 1 n=1 Tax=Parasphaerochaeta coccoides (strain ATCC BAA-1237 / DSM 17374 / SPN1) TaxID=760011 RepID=F4GKY2_PARC1|nr:extracellular solute-binding protein [Parasphaerochaeta coccoides]AEC01895.1 extracellular solute-binding protein family 1 [Parasphaerochaeta coccoides DSM 17374]
MKKAFLLLIILLVATSMVFSAGTKESAGAATASASGTVRWAYWGGEARITRSAQAVLLFESANPGIKVNMEPSGGSGDHFVKVDTQLAAVSGPDIIQMGGNIDDYIKRGALLPLNGYVGTILNTSVIDPGAIEAGSRDGNLYGVTTGANMPALVYNKSLLERSGAPLPKVSMTYDEFRAYLLLIRDKLPKGVYPMMDIGILSSNSTPFGYWTGYNGTPLYKTAENRTYVTPADATKYLELFKDYRDNGLIPPADVAAAYAETNADSSAIVAGKVAIGFLWTNQIGGWQATMTDEIDFIEFPGAAEKNSLWQTQSQYYTVNKDAKNPELAVRFINFLVNSPEAAIVLGSDRGSSASSTARAAGSASAADQKILSYMQVAGPHTSPEGDHVPNDTELNSTLYLIYQRVAFGQITPADGGQQIYDLLIRLISK